MRINLPHLTFSLWIPPLKPGVEEVLIFSCYFGWFEAGSLQPTASYLFTCDVMSPQDICGRLFRRTRSLSPSIAKDLFFYYYYLLNETRMDLFLSNACAVSWASQKRRSASLWAGSYKTCICEVLAWLSVLWVARGKEEKKSINWQRVKILFTVCFCVPMWCLTFQSRDGIFQVEPSWKTQNNSWKVCWSWRLKVCLWPITVLSCGSKAGSDSGWNLGTFVAPPEIAVVLPNVEKLIIARCSQATVVHWQNSNVLESKYW